MPQLSLDTRLDRARALLGQRELDGLLISRPAGRRWLAGFVRQPLEAASSGYAGTLLVTKDRARLLADQRYVEQAEADCAGWEVVTTHDPLGAEIARLAAGLRRIGAEARSLTHAEWTAMAEALPHAELIAVDDELEGLRMAKEPDEVAALERACALTDACFAHLLDWLRPGMAEREVADEIVTWFRANGAEGPAFDPLVLVGARAARPHGRPGDDQLRAGQPVLIDFGCVVNGYHSDMTRTVFMGEASERQRQLYDHVAQAQLRAEEAARPGIIGAELHAVARDALAEAGYGEAFIHGLGHGIGLEIHEQPFLKNWHHPLVAGTALTLEPGIYLPGEIGIRIEDDYLLTDAGARRLTAASRDLIVI